MVWLVQAAGLVVARGALQGMHGRLSLIVGGAGEPGCTIRVRVVGRAAGSVRVAAL